MELRKNPKIDLEKKRGMFLSIGLFLSLLFVFSAFQWSVEVSPVLVFEDEEWGDYVVMIDPIPTVINPPPKPKEIKKVLKNPIVVAGEVKEAIEEIEIPEIDIDFPELTIDEVEMPPEEIDKTFIRVETMPEPEGGMMAFMKFLGENIKYPRLARSRQVQGKVFAQFVIDPQGNITQLEIIKGIGSGCDKEALRVLALAPKWSPGKQRGIPVKVRMIIPVQFRLN